MAQPTRAASFRGLHGGKEILVLPGVWDIPSARLFAGAGFAALGTTSAGIAWTLGRGAGQDGPWSEFLEASRRIAASVDVPVSFDVEAGFATTSQGVCEAVRDAIDAGACGVNLEDGVVDAKLQNPERVEQAIRGIRTMCQETGRDVFINARTDVYLGGVPESPRQLREAIRRGQLYAEAGADGFFVPGVLRAGEIEAIAREVALPLNVYALPGLPDAAKLEQLGVRRISLGCGPLQATLAHTREIASKVRQDGAWDSFTGNWLDYDQAIRACS